MRIAIATEHPDASEIGFLHAVGLAAHSGQSELVTLHVTQGGTTWHAHPQPGEWLQRWGRGGAPVTHRVHECTGQDEIADALISACNELQPDLLVMATHARRGVARAFAGSIAEAVARNVEIPSLILPLDARSLIDRDSGALELRRVLVLGGSRDDAQRGVDAAAWLVRALGARADLSLLHVDDGTPAPSIEAPEGLSLTLTVRSGSVEDAVTSVEYERHPNLVVMVTQGHDQLRDVLWSSRTERVLHEVKLPLLWIPPSFDASSKKV